MPEEVNAASLPERTKPVAGDGFATGAFMWVALDLLKAGCTDTHFFVMGLDEMGLEPSIKTAFPLSKRVGLRVGPGPEIFD